MYFLSVCAWGNRQYKEQLNWCKLVNVGYQCADCVGNFLIAWFHEFILIAIIIVTLLLV